jgi:hypothetical protein
MWIESVILGVALLGAFASAYGAYSSGEGQARRRLVVLSTVLTIAGLLSGFELAYRADAMQKRTAELERAWTIAQTLPVEAIELEVLVDRGSVDAEALRDFAGGMRVRLDGPRFRSQPSLGAGAPQTAPFAIEALKREGFVGVARASIRPPRAGGDDVAARIIESDCILSPSQRRGDGAASPFLAQLAPGKSVCALRVVLDVRRDGVTLSRLLAADRITVTLPRARPEACLGPCEDLIVSVRAVLPSLDGLTPFLVEIGPQAYLAHASRADADTLVFTLPGATVGELAKSYFLQSSAFRNRTAFQYTQGAFFAAYQHLTARQETGTVDDLIWATGRADETAIQGLVRPQGAGAVSLMELPEWCGFGRRSQCWRRLVVFRADGGEESGPKRP